MVNLHWIELTENKSYKIPLRVKMWWIVWTSHGYNQIAVISNDLGNITGLDNNNGNCLRSQC